jgi:putative ABC transport system permease protein
VWKEITTDTLSSGRSLTTSDTYSIVIGGNLANNVFSGIPLNSKVTIEGKVFKVVGILSSGNSVYMPINTAREVFSPGSTNYNSILVKITDDSTNATNKTITEITKVLMMERGILLQKNVDFSISNPAEIQATVSSTLNTISVFLGAIAAISLIVGAIGIANTMFTSVLEKTKEIGIMKAIGAKNRDVLSIFLINSGMIGMVGGIGGALLGVVASGLISSLATSSNSTTTQGAGNMIGSLFTSASINPWLLVGAVAFSVLIGMVAGMIPAYRASRLKPVDALRYE